jgi:hypothetical protein
VHETSDPKHEEQRLLKPIFSDKQEAEQEGLATQT